MGFGFSGGGFGGPSMQPTDDIYGEPSRTPVQAGGGSTMGLAAVNPVAGLVMAVTAGLSAKESYDAAKAAKEAARRAGEAETEFTAEQTRVMLAENERTESLARARAAASGLSGASSEIYISALEESGRADIDWLKKVGESNVQAQIDAGTAAYHAARAQMWGSIGGVAIGLGRAFAPAL